MDQPGPTSSAENSEVSSAESHGEIQSIKSKILQKIRADMVRGEEPGMVGYDSGPGHARYQSGTI